MLERMGWKRGEGLGKEGLGMKDPVRRLAWTHSLGSKRHSVLTLSLMLSAD